MKGIGQKPTTLLALFREHNVEFGKRVGIDRTKETIASYASSCNHLAAFVRFDIYHKWKTSISVRT